MKKIKFTGLMENSFKLNGNKKVLKANKDLIFPDESHEDYVRNNRSISFTDKTQAKLDKLRAEYKISRSAVIRILLDSVE